MTRWILTFLFLYRREQRKKDEEEGWETIQASRHRRDEPAEEPMPANPIYVEELTMTPQERKQNRTFRKQDPYHLPDLDMSIEYKIHVHYGVNKY